MKQYSKSLLKSNWGYTPALKSKKKVEIITNTLSYTWFVCLFSPENSMVYKDCTAAEKVNKEAYNTANNNRPEASAHAFSSTSSAGAYAGFGVGRAEARDDDVKVVLRGPNAGAGVYASENGAGAGAKAELFKDSVSVGPVKGKASVLNGGAKASVSTSGVKAEVKADVISVGASVGPVQAKVGVDFSCEGHVGKDGVGYKLAGTGFSIGKKTGVSFFGNEFYLHF